MGKLFQFYILTALLGSPIRAIIALLIIYFIIDKAYFRILPDFFGKFKASSKIRSLNNQLSINSHNAQAAMEIGFLYFDKKKYEKTIEFLKKAQLKIENSASIHLYLGMAYMELGNPLEGKKELEKAVEMDNRVGYGIPYVYLYENELKSNKRDEKLQKELKEKIDKFGNSEIFYRMGKVYKRNGDNLKAKEMFRNSINYYKGCPKGFKKLQRKWAFFSRFN